MDNKHLTFEQMTEFINNSEFAQISGDYFDENGVEHGLCQHIHLHRQYYIKFKSLEDLKNALSYILLGEMGIKFSGFVKIQTIDNHGVKMFIPIAFSAKRIYAPLPGWDFDDIPNEVKEDLDYAKVFKGHPLIDKSTINWWIDHWKREVDETKNKDLESQKLLQRWINNTSILL